MPERSQSSLSLAQAKDWMSMVSNKLEEQQGLRRLRRRDEMHENLLSVPSRETVKKRRSRSADGRYAHVCFTRKNGPAASADERVAAQIDDNLGNASIVMGGGFDDEAAAVGSSRRASRRERSSRRSSGTLRLLTDASYAQSIQRQREELHQRAAAKRRSSGMLPGSIMQSDIVLAVDYVNATAAAAAGREYDGDAIRIQINGEGIDF